ncbi:50S ribosomal protein L11 methyltransferase [Flavobacteriaceae bacterium]|nr:50S ribosomal protein L11 methyltransferase [Flavobacteriaceae bacterium]
MTLDYTACHFEVTPLQPASDLLIAELGSLGFESFEETPTGVIAYINTSFWNPDLLEGLDVYDFDGFSFSYTIREIPQENWNANWEANFSPIQVDHHCVVRAPFHQAPEVTYDIVIEPKMSFGTGHHETTYMMLSAILQLDCKDKKVMDMGSGTGVLAILAAMKGAIDIDAVDIDHWCYLNAVENTERNKVPFIKVYEGDVSFLSSVDLKEKTYDIFLANINRNILLNDMAAYKSHIAPGGYLLLSGFYDQDLGMIKEKCASLGIEYQSHTEKNDWVAAVFKSV